MSHFDYSAIDVEDYLHELGLTNISKKGNQVWFSCPLSGHMGMDTTPSASMELGTTRMHCFGCGFSGNAVSFLGEYEGVSPLKARKWLRERFGMTFREPEDTFLGEINKKVEKILNRKKEQRIVTHSTVLDEQEVVKRSIDWAAVEEARNANIEEAYPLAYMLDRGFEPNTLDKWAIGWDLISQRISIPIRDEYNNLVGFKGRAVDFLPRYKVLGGPEYGFETYNVSKVLFGLTLAKEYIIQSGEMILTEGELNAIAMHQKGWKNTVGISGKFISSDQEQLIYKNCSRLTLIFDDERDAYNAARQLDLNVAVNIVPPHEIDPADMEVGELTELILNSRSSVLL